MKKLFSEKKRIVDVVLIAALLVLSAVLYLVINGGRTPGAYAVIRVDGETVGSYPLSENGSFALNGGSNTLVIEDGIAWLSYADCPDKLCMKQGKVHYEGQCLTCLPNKLTVTVEGGESNGIDFVT